MQGVHKGKQSVHKLRAHQFGMFAHELLSTSSSGGCAYSYRPQAHRVSVRAVVHNLIGTGYACVLQSTSSSGARACVCLDVCAWPVYVAASLGCMDCGRHTIHTQEICMQESGARAVHTVFSAHTCVVQSNRNEGTRVVNARVISRSCRIRHDNPNQTVERMPVISLETTSAKT